MFAAERKREIKQYLIENKKAEVVKISEILNVSEVTIRRDFEKLENDGFLIRTHGGAIINDPSDDIIYTDSDAVSKPDALIDEILETASALVNDNDVIMLTSGEINRLLAKRLSERKGLTILTNDLVAAINASSTGSNRVICLGGEVDQDNKTISSALTVKNMQKHHVNRLFLEVDGISEILELTVSSQQKADLIETALECSDLTTLLCKYTIFGNKAFLRLGPITMVQSIITNPLLADNYKLSIYNKNIILYTSIDAFEGNI
ncbi:MAG: DeoR/GlpR family DNA-binding transcription regulator [Spirochaetes bacterium]|jgi:DeoR family fructose operon transcriptional repressor|nr:DeoR/GlpR family DNA-binding transcription regulator [Spirochaetota bacterium]